MPDRSRLSVSKSPKSPVVTAKPGRPSRPGSRGPIGLLALQATVGNEAVTAMLQNLQRAPDRPGWADADKGGKGWNASSRIESGFHRVPIDGIELGNQQAFSGTLTKKDGEAQERAKTSESAAGRAIVLVPSGLDRTAPTKVMLHLHGFTSRSFDPYAGWRQRSSDNSVRDVAQDRIEQQMQTLNDPQMIGILPQGVGHSEFGGLVPAPYVDEVMKRLAQVAGPGRIPVPDLKLGYQLVLSAHSGGGETVAKALDAERKAAKGKGADKDRPAGKAPAEVILFEAIYGGQADRVWAWAEFHLTRTLKAIQKAQNPVAQVWALANCPTLRAYRGSEAKPDCVKAYDKLDTHINKWFADYAGELGALAPSLKDHFRVTVLEGAGHEVTVRGLGDDPAGGPLADALSALTNPSHPSKLVTRLDPKPSKALPKKAPAKTTAPATPAAPASTTAPAAVKAPATPAAPATTQTGPAQPHDFVHDATRDTLELLKPDQRAQFAAIDWVDLDYPGAKMKVKDTSEENLAKWQADARYVLWSVTTKKGEDWYIKGAHQDDADALLLALAKVRPGGGERRANAGSTAVLTKSQYRLNPESFDAYIAAQLADVDSYAVGSTTKKTTKKLNKHGSVQFAAMFTAAAADGVYISISNSFRDRGKAEANAKKADNAKAVASFSAHSLGLAVDLNLWTASMGKRTTEVSTAMTNVRRMLTSPAYKWIFEHGADFGFYQYRREPWHWEYNPDGFREKFWAEAEAGLAPEPEAAKPKAKAKK